jgi:hypothetical protein
MAYREKYLKEHRYGTKMQVTILGHTYLEVHEWSDTHPPRPVYLEIIDRFGEDGFLDENREANMATLKAEWEAAQYIRDRVSEYPTTNDLIVALYDTNDKSAIETKRAAVKAKYPKDNSNSTAVTIVSPKP